MEGGGHKDTDCNLVGPLGIGVQVGITIVCMLAMLCVWYWEKSRRKFLDWAFDISKQVVGAAYGKFYNIAQATLFAHLLRKNPNHQDQCVWYLMGITTDCFLTTLLCYIAVTITRPIFLRRCGIDIGDYDEQQHRERVGSDSSASQEESSVEPPECLQSPVRMWLCQVFIWLSQITCVRLLVTAFFFFSQRYLYVFFAGVFEVFGLKSPTAKLIFAVLVFPAFSDTFQIVVQDIFLKDSAKKRDQAEADIYAANHKRTMYSCIHQDTRSQLSSPLLM